MEAQDDGWRQPNTPGELRGRKVRAGQVAHLGVWGVLAVVLAGLGGTACTQGSKDVQRCYDEKNLDLRLHYCSRAIQSGRLPDQQLAGTFYNRGIAYFDKGDHDRAIQDYTQALRLNPNFAAAFNNRGNAYAAKDDYDRAIQNYDQALRLDPNDALACNNRGNAYAAKDDYDRAIQDYTQALRLNPNFTAAFRHRGWARFAQGQFAAAVPDLARAAQLAPADIQSVLWLYVAQSRAGQGGRDDLARAAARLNLAPWPGPVVSLYLGTSTEQAVVAAAADPHPKTQREQQCGAYFYVGEHLLLQGRRAEAAKMFQAAVATGAAHFLEFGGAKAELKRLGY
jgi:lipoprotein NlpI